MNKIVKKGKIFVICMFCTTMLFPITSQAVTRSNQDCTAYYSGTTTASGLPVEIGYCAVHYKNGNHLNPVIPFGTYIYIDSVYSTGQPEPDDVVYTPEGGISVWQVQDTGRGSNLSQYWLDFYFKYAPEATQFGKGKVTYHY